MLKQIVWLIIFTFLPGLELRFSIPVGVGLVQPKWFGSSTEFTLAWPITFVVCVITNIFLGLFWYWALLHIVPILVKIRPIGAAYNWYVRRVQKKIDKTVDKWGDWAVAVFIAIPLPGSGAYSGALAAYLIGLGFRRFLVANALGVLGAGVIVTIISLAGGKAVQSLFLAQ